VLEEEVRSEWEPIVFVRVSERRGEERVRFDVFREERR
jgi:hypothetical protein